MSSVAYLDLQNRVGAVVFVAILFLFGYLWYTRWDRRLLRRLKKAPRSTLSEARDGEVVKVVGTIRSNWVTQVAPLTGLRSAWSFTGAYERRSTRRRWWWEPLAREVLAADFWIDDGTAMASVQGETLRLLSRADYDQGDVGDSEPLTARDKLFLRRHGVPLRRLLGLVERHLRLVETVLEPGDRVAVLGRIRAIVSPSPKGPAFEVGPLPDGYVLVSDRAEALD